jgi:UDP-glucose 4-epimerase
MPAWTLLFWTICQIRNEVFLNGLNGCVGNAQPFTNRTYANPKSFDEVFSHESISCVIHFAALKSNADSIAHPGLYFENNLSSSFGLLNQMEKHGINNLIFSSSATVYGVTELNAQTHNVLAGSSWRLGPISAGRKAVATPRR